MQIACKFCLHIEFMGNGLRNSTDFRPKGLQGRIRNVSSSKNPLLSGFQNFFNAIPSAGKDIKPDGPNNTKHEWIHHQLDDYHTKNKHLEK